MPSITSSLLSGIPNVLRMELLSSYTEIEKNYKERRWEPSELNGGKLCEVVYTIIKGHIDGSYPSGARKPPNMLDACKLLESETGLSRSVRIQIPRMITALYEIRNNRGVGHIGGDVDPNEMDATCILQMSKWILAELIRVFHNVSIIDAQNYVDAISEREIALVWEVNGKYRVLDPTLSKTDQTLLLLYSRVDGMHESELVSSLEYSNASSYRRDILRKLHRQRKIEFDENSRMAVISPLGLSYVENNVFS